MVGAGTEIRLLLIGNEAMTRESLRVLLEREDDVVVVADVTTLSEALDAARETDLIVLDLSPHDEVGSAAMAELSRRFPSARLVVLVSEGDGIEAVRDFPAAAHGYLLKSKSAAELVHAVRSVAAGDRYLDSKLGGIMVSERPRPTMHRTNGSYDPTDREREVIRLLVAGHTNAEIGEILHLSARTVEHHRANVFRKLGVRSRSELIRQVGDVRSTSP